MTNDMAPLVPRFAFNERLLGIETDGFTDADWAWRPPSGGNPAHWILGHVTRYRRVLLRRLGDGVEVAPWEARYARGAETGAALTSTPAELLRAFGEAGRGIAARLPLLTAEELARPWGSKFPDGAETWGAGISFLCFHETYHLGQIGYLRRLLGKPGFA